jgi:rhamnopyranosyl-N-acetylglucosaminyl-diphospho-decaprenol beta-1,3/1,4-galactofuranosyltransferase
MGETVAAIIVTHNRKQLLVQALDALLMQTCSITRIILIDNASTDRTEEFLEQEGYLNDRRIDYVRMHENSGAAGGFHEGIKRGYEAGYDWLWLMDDDAVVKPNALEILLSGVDIYKRGVAVCRVLNPDGTVQDRVINSVKYNDFLFRGVCHGKELGPIVHTYPFLGILVNRHKIEKFGNVNKDYFLQADDLEWTLRISSDYGMSYCANAELFHHDSVVFCYKKFFGKSIGHLDFNSLWKDYYGMRNFILVLKSNSKPYKYIATKKLFKNLINRIFFDHFWKSMKLYVMAYHDGIAGITGKRILPGMTDK